MLSPRTEHLRQAILRIAAQDADTPIGSSASLDDLHGRPVVLMAPLSYSGMAQGPHITARLPHVIAAVDDRCAQDRIHGVPRWSSRQLLDNARQYPNTVALDFSCSPQAQVFVRQLCQAAGIERRAMTPPAPTVIEGFESRPLFLLSPHSYLAHTFAPGMLLQARHAVAVVDDTSPAATLHGLPRWSSSEFLAQARHYPKALAIDLSCTPNEWGMARKLCELAGIERKDAGLAIAHCGQYAVYEPAYIYRQRTLERLDEFLGLADRLDDEFSVFTLYSNLMFRLTYDRSYLWPAWSTPESEYFSARGDSSTFTVGEHEHFCDCGAFDGRIVQKFLEASQYQYRSITAFEPDSKNSQMLQTMASPLTPNFRIISKAISDRQGNLPFEETGTVSSHASPNGNALIPSTRLDDELENLTLLKMDIEGHEAKGLAGASRLIQTKRPRMAICVYHYAQDLLDVAEQLDRTADNYHLRLRQHACAHYHDLVLYAAPQHTRGIA